MTQPAPKQYAMPKHVAQAAEADNARRKKPFGAIVLGAALGVVVATALIFSVLHFVVGFWALGNGRVEGPGNGGLEKPDEGRAEEPGIGRIEGHGFDSAEDAVLAYLDAFSRADLEAMVATFAIESYAENQDFEAMVERLGVYSPVFQQRFPSSNRLTTGFNIRHRQAWVVGEITRQYLALFVAGSESMQGMLTEMDAQDISQLVRDLGNPEYLESLSTLRCVDFVDPNRLDDRFGSEANQQNIERLRDVIGAQRLENIVARASIDGQIYLFFFDVLRYDGKWYIHSLVGNIGQVLSLAAISGGIILEEHLQ